MADLNTLVTDCEQSVKLGASKDDLGQWSASVKLELDQLQLAQCVID